jgi:hypothetical protein
LSVNICMRVAPSPEQLIADSLRWSEELRSVAIMGCDDVFAMVARITAMPSFASTMRGDVATSRVVKLCSEWGLRWQGKPIEKQSWVHIQAIMPFANDGPISTAIGDIKMLFPGIDTLSVVGKVCKAVTSFLKGGFHIDEFQEIRPTTFGMRFAMDCLYHSLLFGDLEKKQIHGNFLTGERVSDIGSIQQALRKLQALDAIWKHYRASPAFSPEVGKQLWEKFESLPVFVKWAAADDFWQKNPAHGFLNGQKGIHYWTAQKFGKLCEDLPSPAAVAPLWVKIRYL